MVTAATKPPVEGVLAPARLSDRALFARAASDEAAFAEIVHRYREPLRRHAARYVGDSDAEDVVQQALVNASLALRREPEREIEPKPWLYRVTTNAAIDHRRARAVRPLGDRPFEEPDLDSTIEAPGGDPHDVVAGRDALRSVVAGIQDLSPNQRRAATARFLEGRSHNEIASELGVSRGAARELISRARRNLRETLPALSPLPLFGKLREAFAGIFAGSASVPAAKLAVSAAVVAVVAGAGGAALKASRDGGGPVATGGSGPAAAAALTTPKLPVVASRPRPIAAAGSAAGQGARGFGGSGQGSGGSQSSSGAGGTAAATAAAGSAPSSGSGSLPNPVQGLAEDLGVGGVTEDLGIPPVTVPQVAEDFGVRLPDVPDVGGALGGGN
ncbi:MAG: RNA polymerase sigma factor [Solirubrobacterales bacterium]